MWSSSPPGGAKSPGATAPRIPAPRDPVRRRPRSRRPRPVHFFLSQAFFSSVTVFVTRASAISIDGRKGKFPDGAARRRASRPTPTQETPGDPRRELITNRVIERDRRIRLRGGRTRARASAPRGGLPRGALGAEPLHLPGLAPTVSRRLESQSQIKKPPSSTLTRPNLSSPSSSPDPKPRARRAPRLPPGRRRPPRSVVRPVRPGDGPIVEAGIGDSRSVVAARRYFPQPRVGVAAAREDLREFNLGV